MKKLNYAVLVALTSVGFYSSAALQTVNVTATIDTQVSMTKTDGQPLDSLEMKYTAAGKLNAASTQVKIISNASKDILVKLQEEPNLQLMEPVSGQATASLPLTVSLGGSTLTTTDTTYSLSKWFNSTTDSQGATVYDTTSGSKPMDLVISALKQSGPLASGTYTGAVNLVIQQATTSS